MLTVVPAEDSQQYRRGPARRWISLPTKLPGWEVVITAGLREKPGQTTFPKRSEEPNSQKFPGSGKNRTGWFFRKEAVGRGDSRRNSVSYFAMSCPVGIDVSFLCCLQLYSSLTMCTLWFQFGYVCL